MVAKRRKTVKRKVARKVDRRTGGWALFHSKRQAQVAPSRLATQLKHEREERKKQADRKAAQEREIERNQQRAKVYESRAKILESKTRARMAGKASRSTFFGGKPSSGRGGSLTRRRKVGKTSVSFW